jgi:hypothetical protein
MVISGETSFWILMLNAGTGTPLGRLPLNPSCATRGREGSCPITSTCWMLSYCWFSLAGIFKVHHLKKRFSVRNYDVFLSVGDCKCLCWFDWITSRQLSAYSSESSPFKLPVYFVLIVSDLDDTPPGRPGARGIPCCRSCLGRPPWRRKLMRSCSGWRRLRAMMSASCTRRSTRQTVALTLQR